MSGYARIDVFDWAETLVAALNPTYALCPALIPLVRQHRQGVELDPFLVQLPGFVGRGMAVERAVVDLAVMHLAGFLGKLLPEIIGVLGQMLAQLLELLAQLALLRRHHGDRRRFARRLARRRGRRVALARAGE